MTKEIYFKYNTFKVQNDATSAATGVCPPLEKRYKLREETAAGTSLWKASA